MKVASYQGGVEIHIPTSGGKAGKGYNKTSTIQVWQGSQIVKQIRFTVLDEASRKRAYEKAKACVRQLVTNSHNSVDSMRQSAHTKPVR